MYGAILALPEYAFMVWCIVKKIYINILFLTVHAVASLIPRLTGQACLRVWNAGGQVVLPGGWLRACDLVVCRCVGGKTPKRLTVCFC
jgi:hypothetical protein